MLASLGNRRFALALAVMLVCVLAVLSLEYASMRSLESAAAAVGVGVARSALALPVAAPAPCSTLPPAAPAERKFPYESLAFIKTHKSGSTTVFSLMLRYAVVRQLRILPPYPRPSRDLAGRDLVSTHQVHPEDPIPRRLADISMWHTLEFNASLSLFEYFRTHLRPEPAYVTIVRNPRDRMLSHWHFFDRSHARDATVAGASTATFARYRDQTCRDLSIFSDDDLTEFKRRYWRSTVILVLDRMPESLLMLQRRLGWQLSDLVTPPTQRGCRTSNDEACWRFEFDRLDAAARDNIEAAIDANTECDRQLYDWALSRLDLFISQQPQDQWGCDLHALQLLQSEFEDDCSRSFSTQRHAQACFLSNVGEPTAAEIARRYADAETVPGRDHFVDLASSLEQNASSSNTF